MLIPLYLEVGDAENILNPHPAQVAYLFILRCLRSFLIYIIVLLNF